MRFAAFRNAVCRQSHPIFCRDAIHRVSSVWRFIAHAKRETRFIASLQAGCCASEMEIKTRFTRFYFVFHSVWIIFAYMLQAFHPLDTDIPKPLKFNDPFCYEPHSLCLLAARGVQDYIAGDADVRADADRGKMFGVLVVETADGLLGYTAAYSGLLCGSNDHGFFVPPVFDATPPDGYFKTHEAWITAINRRIDDLTHSVGYRVATRKLAEMQETHKAMLDDYRRQMAQAKLKREARRQRREGLTPEDEAQMVRESQFMKAEYKRMKRRFEAEEAPAKGVVDALHGRILTLKTRRRQMSDELQQWLFSQYSMLNARGEARSLCSIFAGTPQGVPPSGAGDCCAPKLLQHAYLNGLRPVSMAEFWWGASPAGEVRHHLRFYPACRGKCLPILGHMLQGLEVERGSLDGAVTEPLEIVYEDEWLAVVCKPAGMLSVPGRDGGVSVVGEMRARHPDRPQTNPVHRLDMDTSGLLLVSFDVDTYRKLQAQFVRREVRKRYVALLDGVADRPAEGRISLPLRPDPLDRPYQKVDFAHGKEAVTDYRVIKTEGGVTRVDLFPLTGRTHQLRVHCAHAAGLGSPILGDRLYGRGGGRLCLHAEALEFVHPVTGKRMKFERRAGF